jgi:hypothetical protein
MSMKDLYNSNRLCVARVTLPMHPCGGDETGASQTITDLPSALERLRNVTSTNANSEPEKRPTEGHRTSSLGISHGRRRRYKSDCIQVRSTRCHLGDPVAPLDPARADITCAFWGSALERSEEKGEALEREVFGPGFLSGSLAEGRIGRNKLEQTEGSSDAVLSGIVVTPEGELVVPASKRQDGR